MFLKLIAQQKCDRDIAKNARVHPATVSRWLRGHQRPGKRAAALLELIYGLPVDVLLAPFRHDLRVGDVINEARSK